MKKIFISLLLAVVFSPISRAQDAGSLMPIPQKVSYGSDKLLVSPDFTVAVTGSPANFVYDRADDFLRRIAGRTGIFITQERITKDAAPISKPSVLFEVGAPGILSIEMKEDYEIEITAAGIKVKASSSFGALHAMETLLQWMNNDNESYYFLAGSISDAPRFPWRGILIDPARHWLPVDVIKRNIDAMSAVKMNVLHLHLTEDQGFRIESKAFPKLHELGGEGDYYTQEQMRDIIQYAADRGIRVIPEFDIPGHATSWLVGYPELATLEQDYKIEREWGIMNPVLDPSKESTYEFLDVFLTEMSALFPDAYLHIGGDENNGKHWNQAEHIQAFKKEKGFKDNHELQAYFNQHVLEILTKNNKKMVGWDEIQHPAIPKNVVIQSWRGPEGLKAAAKAGYQVMLSNGYYIDLIQPASFHYLNDPLPEGHGLTTEEQALVMGGEATMWGEQVSHETIDSRIWPRTAAIAERLWSDASVKDLADMYARMKVLSLQLEELGLLHEKNYEMMLRRLCKGKGLDDLRMLADVCEPVKIYKRNALSTVNALMPYTRFVDATRPDAETARNFNLAVDLLLDQRKKEHIPEIKKTLEYWYKGFQNLEVVLDQNPSLHEIKPLALSLRDCSFLGLQALAYIENGESSDSVWRDYTKELTNKAKQPHGEAELMVVSGIVKLIEASK